MATQSRYAAGAVIVQENDVGDTAYVIEQGQVEVSKALDGHKVHLAYLGAGATFGEMSMIDEKPRSATVTAVTEVVVHEIRRDDFFASFQSDPTVALPLLKILFERLRESDAMILQLQTADPQPARVVKDPGAGVPMPPRGQPTITLEGVTPQAVAALPVNPFPITHFPFRIGRQSADPLVYNDLMLPDSVPPQISRHHLTFIVHEGRVGVVDRGSAQGSWLGVLQIGGPSGRSGPVFLTGAEALLVLGSRESPFRFRVSLPNTLRN